MHRRKFILSGGQMVLGATLPFLLNDGAIYGAKPRETQGLSEPLIRELEGIIPELLRESAVPGLSIALVRDGKLYWRSGFGLKDAASGERVDDNTVFEAASVSKTVFAYATMKACEKGVMNLDTPLTRYTARRFLEGDPRLDLITARHLLSHTSGFQDWRSEQEPLRIHFAPGKRFMYSGEGYYYLQSVLTELIGHEDRTKCARYEAGFEVCATDIDAVLRREILEPFEMKSSGYVWNELFEKQAARPHDTKGKPLTKKKPSATDAARYASAGGLHTTATDYARFLIEILNPKGNDTSRLNGKSRAEMVRPQVKLGVHDEIDGASSWALGWAVRERESGNVLVHSGGQEGFRSLTMASLKRNCGFVVLTNGDNGGRVFYNPEFARKINELLGELF